MDKTKRNFIFFTVICVFLILFFIIYTVSRYKSDAESNANIQTALYLLKEDHQTMNISLDSMIPSDTPYVYTFSISNNDGKNRTEVNLEYDLKITTTTNLPLTYQLYLNQDYTNPNSTNIIKENEVNQDEYGTYFRHISTDTQKFDFNTDKTNIYTLVIYFDSKYKDIKYQDIIEGIEINVDSKQIV